MTQMTTYDLHNATIARLSDEVAALTRELAAERERADRAKAEGIKEGLRRAAEIAESWGLEKVAKWGHDEEMLVDAKSRAWDGLQIKAAILKEAGE